MKSYQPLLLHAFIRNIRYYVCQILIRQTSEVKYSMILLLFFIFFVPKFPVFYQDHILFKEKYFILTFQNISIFLPSLILQLFSIAFCVLITNCKKSGSCSDCKLLISAYSLKLLQLYFPEVSSGKKKKQQSQKFSKDIVAKTKWKISYHFMCLGA